MKPAKILGSVSAAILMIGTAQAAPSNEELLAMIKALQSEVKAARAESQRAIRAENELVQARREVHELRARVRTMEAREGARESARGGAYAVAPQVAPSQSFQSPPSWSGAFVGIGAVGAYADGDRTNLNAGASTNGFSFQVLDQGPVDGTGMGLSLAAGYLFQPSASIVAGIRGEVSALDLGAEGTTVRDTRTFNNGVLVQASNGTAQGDVQLRGTASALAQFGVLARHDLLIYGVGGYTVAKLEDIGAERNIDAHGYTLGLGGEWRFARNWSFGTEYRFTSLSGSGADVSTNTFTLGLAGTEFTNLRGDYDLDIHTLRFGFTHYFE